MGRLIRKLDKLSRGKKTFSILALVVFCSVVALVAANAQPEAIQAKAGVSTDRFNPNTPVFSSQEKVDTSSRGRAPEPATVTLMGSGFVAAIVRFARRRFQEFKRGFDVFMALVGLILSAPFVLLSIAIIKITSPGPAFFTQTRVGRGGQLFQIFKLRTMVCDAEKQTGPVWAKANDPRVTPFGKFLRKSHIDEIPQLVNVLKGEMSLIGPRPERPEFVDGLSGEIHDYQKRLKIRPGITGLAQVRHRYDETIKDVRKKVKLDLLYIKRMCFLTDFRIILSTVLVVLTGRGAR